MGTQLGVRKALGRLGMHHSRQVALHYCRLSSRSICLLLCCSKSILKMSKSMTQHHENAARFPHHLTDPLQVVSCTFKSSPEQQSTGRDQSMCQITKICVHLPRSYFSKPCCKILLLTCLRALKPYLHSLLQHVLIG